jgi:hypothetical protein
VLCFPADRQQWRAYGYSPTRIDRAFVSSTSEFRIGGLPAGDYFVVAVPEGHAGRWKDPSFFEVAVRRAIKIHLEWGETLRLTLPLVR